jgi:hypothetical protein
MVKPLFVFVLTLVVSSALRAQCILPSPDPGCNGTEPLAASGQTISTASTRWYYGSPQTFTSLTLDGGTLIVCGDLTINSFTFNSGVIFVRPGASLTVTSGPALLMQGNCYVYNYGRMVLQRGLVLDNAHASVTTPNVFINAGVSSTLEMLFDWLVINNPYSWFVNEGKASMHGIVTDPLSAAGSVCLGNKSQVYMGVLINNAAKTYTAPSGPACVAVSDHAYICEGVTADATVNICMGVTGGTDSSCLVSRGKTRPWGNAVLFNSCTTCGAIAVLPIHPADTSAAGSRVNVVDGRGTATVPEIYPNPFTSGFSIRMPAGERALDVSLMDIWGGVVRHLRPGGNTDGVTALEAQGIAAGCYVLRIVTKKKVYLQRVLKR